MSERTRRPGRQRRFRPRVHPVTLARRALAAVLLATAGLSLTASGDERGAHHPVLVTARDLPSGTTLSAADVRIATLPARARPAGALNRPEQVAGRRLAGSARSGEPLTDARLVDARNTPAGTVAVPVRLADDGVAGLLQPGTPVELIAPAGTAGGSNAPGAEVLSTSATVLAVVGRAAARDGPHSAAGAEPGDEPGLSAVAEPLILVAVPEDDAPRVAAAALGRPVTVTLR